jgi:hypothetical protein
MRSLSLSRSIFEAFPQADMAKDRQGWLAAAGITMELLACGRLDAQTAAD